MNASYKIIESSIFFKIEKSTLCLIQGSIQSFFQHPISSANHVERRDKFHLTSDLQAAGETGVRGQNQI